MNIARVVLLLIGLSFSSGCSYLWPFGDSKKETQEAVAPTAAANSQTQAGGQISAQQNNKETAPVTDSAKPVTRDSSTEAEKQKTAETQVEGGVIANTPSESLKPPAASDPALVQARLMARLDDLESEVKRQREKIRLLEQGLLTGIAPDDLKKSKGGKSAKGEAANAKNQDVSDLPKPEVEDLSLPPKKQMASSEADSAINAKFQIAKEHYQAARFGMAVAELAGISREYGPKTLDGSVKAWLGKCYLAMKEYPTARSEFEFYVKEWPTGALIADVRLGLAKTYYGMGLRERAQSELKKVIKDFDGQESSEIAAAELQKIQGSL